MNMFRLRCTSENQPRRSSGHPAHAITGVASESSRNRRARPGRRCSSPRPWAPMPTITSGAVSAAAVKKRRRIRASSTSSVAVSAGLATRGSRCMPHFGQSPGWSLTTSGCMGQVHTAAAVPAGGTCVGSRGGTGGAGCSPAACGGWGSWQQLFRATGSAMAGVSEGFTPADGRRPGSVTPPATPPRPRTCTGGTRAPCRPRRRCAPARPRPSGPGGRVPPRFPR